MGDRAPTSSIFEYFPFRNSDLERHWASPFQTGN